jgi:DhnA family fructose-bisphosphate aldolase class Ia
MPDHAEVLRRLRAERPDAIAEAWRNRRRRTLLGPDRVFLLAVDHPARNALGVGDDPMAMADRVDLLDRVSVALARPGVDGILATADILDDLAALGLLDDRIVVGSVNRGGLRGASFEFDDRRTGYDIPGAVAVGADAVKVLLRVALDDPGTLATLETVARQLDEAAAARLPMLVEPFLSERVGPGSVRNLLDPDSVIRSVAIASGLGSTSAYTWLKLPVVADMARVAAATTLPILLLGGDPDPEQDVFEEWRTALELDGVRGLVAGRALLYPHDGDILGAVDRAAALVRGRA